MALTMFLLGVAFASGIAAALYLGRVDAQDDHLEEMAKWYEEEYPNDEIR